MTTDIERLQGLELARAIRLPSADGTPEQSHLFDEPSVLALQSAIAAKRPLLIRGEPGVGKTQLALAAATVLERPFVSFVVDGRTESTDLLWKFDSIRRLAEAQLCGALELDDAAVEKRLDIDRYISPGPLWWAFHWNSAKEQADQCVSKTQQTPHGGNPNSGCVVLIDEIDKADSDVPNGLLEALGSGQFTTESGQTVQVGDNPSPLVIITTNEERTLPDAFVRRCLVLSLELPDGAALKSHLIDRGRAHFQRLDKSDDGFQGDEIATSLLSEAAELLIADRLAAVSPLPGLAEYLDLLRAVREMAANGVASQNKLLESVRQFTLRKHSS